MKKVLLCFVLFGSLYLSASDSTKNNKKVVVGGLIGMYQELNSQHEEICKKIIKNRKTRYGISEAVKKGVMGLEDAKEISFSLGQKDRCLFFQRDDMSNVMHQINRILCEERCSMDESIQSFDELIAGLRALKLIAEKDDANFVAILEKQRVKLKFFINDYALSERGKRNATLYNMLYSLANIEKVTPENVGSVGKQIDTALRKFEENPYREGLTFSQVMSFLYKDFSEMRENGIKESIKKGLDLRLD